MKRPDPPILLEGLDDLTAEEIDDLAASLPPAAAALLLNELTTTRNTTATTPLQQAQTIDTNYVERPHLKHISDQIAAAVTDVETGTSRRLIIELPPRTGKTTLTTLFTPAWILARHPEWPIVLTSHDGSLATSWGRQIRRWVEEGRLDVDIAPDAGAASEWETTAGGSVTARSVRASLTGRGAKCLIIDDPHRDFVDAHSVVMRDNVWDWWLSVAQTRLESPTLVIVVATRWHEDDLIGRLLSKDYPGEPDDWEEIRLPAIAEEHDVLGRAPGVPLLSPLLDEDTEEATVRLEEVRRSVGTYTFSALYQQRPAPAQGMIFDASWWKYWTTDLEKVSGDGRVVFLDPNSPEVHSRGIWVESWDFAFKGGETSDFVVGQRWVRYGADRFLIAQARGRWTFTRTLAAVRGFSAAHVPTRLVEEAANGAAVIDTLKREITGLIAVKARDGKEARARAVSPTVEAGNVFLPLPSDPGNEWTAGLLSELRNFPHDAHDDQVDALTQALARLQDAGKGGVTVPGRSSAGALGGRRDWGAVARSDAGRRRGVVR